MLCQPRTKQLLVIIAVFISTLKKLQQDLLKMASITTLRKPYLKESLCMASRVALLEQTSCKRVCQKLLEKVGTKKRETLSKQHRAMSLLIVKSHLKISKDIMNLLEVRKV